MEHCLECKYFGLYAGRAVCKLSQNAGSSDLKNINKSAGIYVEKYKAAMAIKSKYTKDRAAYNSFYTYNRRFYIDEIFTLMAAGDLKIHNLCPLKRNTEIYICSKCGVYRTSKYGILRHINGMHFNSCLKYDSSLDRGILAEYFTVEESPLI